MMPRPKEADRSPPPEIARAFSSGSSPATNSRSASKSRSKSTPSTRSGNEGFLGSLFALLILSFSEGYRWEDLFEKSLSDRFRHLGAGILCAGAGIEQLVHGGHVEKLDFEETGRTWLMGDGVP